MSDDRTHELMKDGSAILRAWNPFGTLFCVVSFRSFFFFGFGFAMGDDDDDDDDARKSCVVCVGVAPFECGRCLFFWVGKPA